MENSVQDGMVVALAYTLTLDDGTVVDWSSEAEPLEYIHGYGQIITGLEDAISGMVVGERRQVEVAPADAYGEYVPNMELDVPLASFPPSLAPEVGLGIFLESESGERFPYWVSKVEEGVVTLDPNHPLAGETLHFDVQVIGIRPATEEELAHGHIHHGAGHP
jgi:FKBP-type peptidyl-prolyl cis-trans isomerase SlyD